MAYALDNAMYQWQDGERLVNVASGAGALHLERAVAAVMQGLRRGLGSTFSLLELSDLYGEGTDWAEDIATRTFAGSDTAAVVDCAFARYARESSDFAGGRFRPRDAD
jgi:hypothetical protein